MIEDSYVLDNGDRTIVDNPTDNTPRTSSGFVSELGAKFPLPVTLITKTEKVAPRLI